MYLRIISLLLLALPALAFTQTPGEKLVMQSRKNLQDLKAIGGRLDRIGARFEVLAQDKAKPKYGRGYVLPSKEVSKARHERSDAIHGHTLKQFHKMMAAVTLPASFDCRTQWKLPGIDDQGQCGNCYWWSAVRAWYTSQIISGHIKATDVSPTIKGTVQYGLDYYPQQGGCNGGDEDPCARLSIAKGFPLPGNYPGVGQSPGSKRPITGTVLTVDSLMYCTVGADGNSPLVVNDVKNCLMKYGPVSFAAAADSWGEGTQVITDKGGQVDHAITIYGWDDSKGAKGAWLVMNQWSTQWGNDGFCWLGYGACNACEGFVCVTAPVAPPQPVPPQPQPPQPTGPVTITLTAEQVAAVLAASGTTPPTANTIVITPELATAFQTIADAFSKAAKK